MNIKYFISMIGFSSQPVMYGCFLYSMWYIICKLPVIYQPGKYFKIPARGILVISPSI
jgi:hypothetical protein